MNDEKQTVKQRAAERDEAIAAYERLQVARAAIEREVTRLLAQIDTGKVIPIGGGSTVDDLRDLVRVARTAATDLRNALTEKGSNNGIRN